MKKLSKKWLILDHYIQTAEFEKDGSTVRVWKPRFMGKLPALDMRVIMNQALKNLRYCSKVTWSTCHPDLGFWDAQITECFDPHRHCADVYICALLCRPFSEEARQYDEERSGLQPMDRLILMWDSRQFDADGGYKTDGYGSFEYIESDHSYEDFFHVMNENDDIEDSSK